MSWSHHIEDETISTGPMNENNDEPDSVKSSGLSQGTIRCVRRMVWEQGLAGSCEVKWHEPVH